METCRRSNVLFLPCIIHAILLSALHGRETSATECVENDCQNITKVPLKFEDIVPKHYDKLVPPTNDGEVAIVEIKVAILNIQFVDEAKQAYVADIFFHQYWKDSRVKIPETYHKKSIVLDPKWRHHLWTPDTYFKNLVDGKVNDIIIPYSYMLMDDDSELFFATRMSLKLNCGMKLMAYPHDEQECEIVIMSLQYTTDTVILKWKDFQVTKNIFLAQYYIKNHTQETGRKHYGIGEFSYLVGRLQLKRRLGYFLINKYIPCILIVCMAFVTFWIPAEAYPARVTLSVTSLLTIVTQQYQSSVPSVSYVVALNIWMLSCIGFVFFSLLEYAFVIGVMNNKGTTMWPFTKLKKLLSARKSQEDSDGEIGRMSNKPANHIGGEQTTKVSHRTIDKASRVVFPLFFSHLLHLLFCLFLSLIF